MGARVLYLLLGDVGDVGVDGDVERKGREGGMGGGNGRDSGKIVVLGG